jgi:hypothetical protein
VKTVPQILEEFLLAAKTFAENGHIAPLLDAIVESCEAVGTHTRYWHYAIVVGSDLAKGVAKRKHGTTETPETPEAQETIDEVVFGSEDGELGDFITVACRTIRNAAIPRYVKNSKDYDGLVQQVQATILQQRARYAPKPSL